jgi:hypothetical protein
MPNITFPSVDISQVNQAAADVNDALKEGAYVALGLGVIGFQRAQVQRVELTKQLNDLSARLSELLAPARTQLAKGFPVDLPTIPDLSQQLNEVTEAIEEQLGAVRTQLAELAKAVDERVQPVRKQVDEQFDRLEQYLPGGARNVVQSVRSASTGPEQLLRSAVGLD